MSQTATSLPAALNLRGTNVLVTGAASGIGRATAIVLAQLGADLLVTDRAPLDDLRAELERLGATCTAEQGDLTSDAFIASLFARQPLRAMAHCAAILEGRNWREDRNWPDRFHRVMDINVRVPLTLATAAIDHMVVDRSCWWVQSPAAPEARRSIRHQTIRPRRERCTRW
jgi:3-oxoacyl-[acyl-carrier protein] reductase